MTTFSSKLCLSLQSLADHILWLHSMGLLKLVDKNNKQLWIDRANKFWLYSASINLARDFYELICVIQTRRSRKSDNLESDIINFNFKTPIKWARSHPKLSCDLIKNACDFWIPYSSINKLDLHPSLIGFLGIISSVMGILQIYDKSYRLSST